MFENIRFLFVTSCFLVSVKMTGASAGIPRKRLSIAIWCTILRLSRQGFKKRKIELELKLDPIDKATFYRNLKVDYGNENDIGEKKFVVRKFECVVLNGKIFFMYHSRKDTCTKKFSRVK